MIREDMNQRYNKFNIGIITGPFNNIAGTQNLANLIQTLEPLSNKITAITGDFPEYPNKIVRIIRLKSLKAGGTLQMIQILNHLLVELQICFNMLRMFRHIDIVVFHIGARAYPLSAFLSKLLRKKIVVFSFNTFSKNTFSKLAQIGEERRFSKKQTISSYLATILEKFTLLLADQIAVESESVIKFSNIERYRDKISIYGAKYIDMNLFKVKKELKERPELIGYIGRLEKVKGVLELAKAFPFVLKSRSNIEFLVGGDGALFDEITEELESNGVYSQVKLVREIPHHPHNEVPNYLNEMKLLILPSYTEGVPGIVQEAMACGTPVLATPVGGIPDLIKDRESGFIMENNSPECIAKNVIRALEYPNFDKIVKNARKRIEDEYAYEATVRKRSDLLNELMKDK